MLASILVAWLPLACAQVTQPVRVGGRPDPQVALILLPGLTDTAQDLRRHGVLRELERCDTTFDVRVIYRSWRLSPAELAAAVDAAANDGPGDATAPVVVVGISLGTKAVATMAAARPDAIHGIVAYAPRPDRPWPRVHRHVVMMFGSDDRHAHRLREIASGLPADHVVTAPDGHNWPTFRTLWTRFLDRDPLDICHGP